jgi:hypothetical protein|tara:strand:- start:1090 stop:1959 length:870 start_codon:yes stop_codon:yes gene_type:complete
MWTFGFPTVASENEDHLAWRDKIMTILDSIRSQNIPEYEIIIVGGPYPKNGRNAYRLHAFGDVKHIPFDDQTDWVRDDSFTDLRAGLSIKDENSEEYVVRKLDIDKRKHPGVKSGWTTRKKNLIWQNAKYENVVIFHDYYKFDKDWFAGFNKFGYDWDFCWNVKHTVSGDRYRDWILWDHPTLPKRLLLPYGEKSLIRNQYFDGNYTVGKKSAWEKYPLNEDLLHYYGDDIEWSYRVRKDQNLKLDFNPHSKVEHVIPRTTGDERYSWETEAKKERALNYLKAKYPEEW